MQTIISLHLIVWRQLPEDPIVLSLIPREEAKPQVCIGRVAQAFSFIIFYFEGTIFFGTPGIFKEGIIIRVVISVWPPIPPCCRGGSQGESQAHIVIGVPCDPADGFLAAGVKL